MADILKIIRIFALAIQTIQQNSGMITEIGNDILSIRQTLSDVWDFLTEQEQQLLLTSIKTRLCRKNGIIYHMGDEPNYIFCIVKGNVKLSKEGVGGRQQITRTW